MTLLKHKSNTDVAMAVVAKELGSDDTWYIKCLWYNIVNPKNVFLVAHKLDEVAISKSKMPEWEEVRYDHA